MKIVVDGMGGDNAPQEVVKGVVAAILELKDLNIIITGPENLLNKEIAKYEFDKSKIKIVNADEVITNDEAPVKAIRTKKNSSLYKALELVKTKEADAMVSAGSTGAFMAGCTFVVGRIKGVERPALAPIMPGKNSPFMVIDVGANVDCKPKYLLQFGIMGKAYYESILNIENPSVGLVNIGAEEEKGNELTKAAYALLKESNLNFVGNVEPRNVPEGNVNVLVCDGFVGNTILKTYEGVAEAIFTSLKAEIMSSTRSKVGGMLLKPVFKSFKKKFDYEEYGGSAFLGVNGVCIKTHGSSKAKAFKNAIKAAKITVENGVIEKISDELSKNSTTIVK